MFTLARPFPMIRPRPALGLIAALVLVGCDTLPGGAVPDSAPDICEATITTPAVIETVTELVVDQPGTPATDGSAAIPSIQHRTTQQKIVQERTETRFETPCAATMTPEFIMSVQRALQVRGLYGGEITGEIDNATQSAIRAYQKPLGFDTGTLSVSAARKLGLMVIEPV